MPKQLTRSLWILGLVLAAAVHGTAAVSDNGLPKFDRDTVLVWQSKIGDEKIDMVVRIASFWPDRFLEWENSTTQGTVLMTQKALTAARSFSTSRLFEAGCDTVGKDYTILWLSQSIYRDLKSKRRLKIKLDSLDGWITLDGNEAFPVEVNREHRSFAVIRVKDDRGSERWFLDSEENPLLVKHMIRNFNQQLVSVTTDRSGTLRWIKGRKLNGLPK